MQGQEFQVLEAVLVKLEAGWKQLQESITKDLTGLDVTLKSLAFSSEIGSSQFSEYR
ncbi:MAG: hypothetical protein M3Z08_04485 [Chloroflexota bacterium]|nr:hypothetical protein [Chloroflexota bacterium]